MRKDQSAVNKLLALAKTDCGSSRAAAAVLLCAYDASRYPLDITELCLLDADHLSAAMMVISLRVWNGQEPHEHITNGSDKFAALINDWGQVLHINNRTEKNA